jgi:hypothetical protein
MRRSVAGLAVDARAESGVRFEWYLKRWRLELCRCEYWYRVGLGQFYLFIGRSQA